MKNDKAYLFGASSLLQVGNEYYNSMPSVPPCPFPSGFCLKIYCDRCLQLTMLSLAPTVHIENQFSIERRMIMKLQEQMDTFKKNFVEQAPEQVVETMVRSGEKLRVSGILNRVVKIGDKAPDFSLRNTSKAEVSLNSLLVNGPVVLSFFRGRW